MIAAFGAGIAQADEEFDWFKHGEALNHKMERRAAVKWGHYRAKQKILSAAGAQRIPRKQARLERKDPAPLLAINMNFIRTHFKMNHRVFECSLRSPPSSTRGEGNDVEVRSQSPCIRR